MSSFRERLNDRVRALQNVKDIFCKDVESTHKIISECLSSGGKVLVCGNGGSAADAQHFAAELVVKFLNRRRAFAALSLCTDPSVITACANDFGWNTVFSRQVNAHGCPGDVLVAISTSGTSQNVLNAIIEAERRDMKIIFLTGIEPPEIIEESCDIVISTREKNTALTQEIHEMVLHYLAEKIEANVR